MEPLKRRSAPLALRLFAALAVTAAQAVFAAHVHEIPAPARAASVRRADARDAAAECPVCHLAGHTRAASVSAPPAAATSVSFVVPARRSDVAVSAALVRDAARGPPAAV